MATREPIYVALWNLITAYPQLRASFVTWSRYARHFDTVDLSEMPALFMVQSGEGWAKPGKGVPAKRTLKCHLLVYAPTPQPNAQLPATLINNLLDYLDSVIENPGNPANVQTLGGLVEHVYITGEVEIAEGYLQDKSIAVVPMEMLIP